MMNVVKLVKVPVGGVGMVILTNVVVPIVLEVIKSKMAKDKATA